MAGVVALLAMLGVLVLAVRLLKMKSK